MIAIVGGVVSSGATSVMVPIPISVNPVVVVACKAKVSEDSCKLSHTMATRTCKLAGSPKTLSPSLGKGTALPGV